MCSQYGILKWQSFIVLHQWNFNQNRVSETVRVRLGVAGSHYTCFEYIMILHCIMYCSL